MWPNAHARSRRGGGAKQCEAGKKQASEIKRMKKKECGERELPKWGERREESSRVVRETRASIKIDKY